ncbi:flagellin N-terminal helical domain-containing protein [Priestia flexa]|uniref:flagellin N-terminal helical domain-containing protein n=1 Tax=Priestia flexa TaxID=86664 RepID=UPI00077C9A0E|nr:flagellin [Priestia flexa]MED4590260.1 flagellin [Priestia flexa]
MRINHNIAALNTYRQLNSASTAQSKSMEKLSSGLRINKAGDDAAGLAISEKMRGQIRGLDQASKNSQDAISLVQTAEGALNETHDILQRMRELAVQAGNDTNTTSDREEIQKEINQMTSEINRIGNTTEFNTQKLLNGSKDSATTGSKAKIEFDLTGMTGGKVSALGIEEAWDTDIATTAGNLKATIEADADLNAKYTVTVTSNKVTIEAKANGEDNALKADLSGATAVTSSAVTTTAGEDDGAALNFQIGANENQSLTLDISDMRAVALGISTTGNADAKLAVTDGTSNTTTEQALSVLTHDDAAATVTTIQSAIDKVSAERSKLGANQNRLEHTINNLSTSSENLTAAESRIRDVDMAKEMMEQTKNSILSQAAQAMLAQANQQPQGVLQLLR